MHSHYQKILDGPDAGLFSGGACHVFALALHVRFRYPLRIILDTDEDLPKGASHVFCKFDESRGVDVLGLFDEEQHLIKKDWMSPRYEVVDTSPHYLKRFETLESGGGLYNDEAFLDQAHSRALKLIERYFDHYSGQIPSPIPELQRELRVPWQNFYEIPDDV